MATRGTRVVWALGGRRARFEVSGIRASGGLGRSGNMGGVGNSRSAGRQNSGGVLGNKIREGLVLGRGSQAMGMGMERSGNGGGLRECREQQGDGIWE